jgi:protein ImuA
LVPLQFGLTAILYFCTVQMVPVSLALQQIVNAEPLGGAGSLRPLDIGQLPSRVSQVLWRGTALGQADKAVVSSGFAALDAQLPGGGWPCNAVTELLQPQLPLCEWRLLSPALAGLSALGGRVLLVGPPKRPHMPGLIKLGLADKNLVWIAADTPAERLWTTEQLVKANPRGGAILAWLPQARTEQIRRLQVHAQSCDCPVFLFRPEAAQFDASPAPLRVAVTLGADWQLLLRILKRKGALMDGVIAIPSIPGTLASVFTPRLLHPSQLIAKTEVAHGHALGRTVAQPRQPQLAAH